MIPEYASPSEMKRVLEALHMNPERQDIVLTCVMERYGLNAQALGRTGTQDHYHYATTFAFSLPKFLTSDDVCALLKRAARDAYMWLYRWEINRTDAEWHHGIVSFFGMTPFGETRRKYYDDPPKPNAVERYVLDVAERLKQRADE